MDEIPLGLGWSERVEGSARCVTTRAPLWLALVIGAIAFAWDGYFVFVGVKIASGHSTFMGEMSASIGPIYSTLAAIVTSYLALTLLCNRATLRFDVSTFTMSTGPMPPRRSLTVPVTTIEHFEGRVIRRRGAFVCALTPKGALVVGNRCYGGLSQAKAAADRLNTILGSSRAGVGHAASP